MFFEMEICIFVSSSAQIQLKPLLKLHLNIVDYLPVEDLQDQYKNT